MNRRRGLVDGIAAFDDALRRGHELTAAILGDVNRIAGDASKSNTKKLCAMIGAGAGGLGAVGVCLATTVTLLPVLFPLLVVSGGAVGALLWTGSKGTRLEQHLHHRQTVLATILADIKGLPKTAPEATKAALWDQYDRVASSTISNQDLRLPILIPKPQPKKRNRPLASGGAGELRRRKLLKSPD